MINILKTPLSSYIRDYWGIFLKHKWLMIMPVLVIPLTSMVTAYFITPTYESSTTILMRTSNVLPVEIKRELGARGPGFDHAAFESQRSLLAQIKSPRYIKSLITKLDITVPEELIQADPGQTAGRNDISPVEIAENLLIKSIQSNIEVRMISSDIVAISVTSTSPEMARKMTQTLAEIFLEESLAQELAGVQEYISFTEDQLNIYREKLYKAQNKLKQYRENIIAVSLVEDTTTLSYNLDIIISMVKNLEIEIMKADDEQSRLYGELLQHDIDISSMELPDHINKMHTELLNTASRLAEYLGRYSWRDAKVVTINKQAENLSSAINDQIDMFVLNSNPELLSAIQNDLTGYLKLNMQIDFMREKNASLNRSIGKIKAQLMRDPAVEVDLDRLQDEVDRYRNLYYIFARHTQYAAIDQSAKKIEAETKFMIIKPAEIPLKPANPDRFSLLIMSIILGLMVGIGAILLKVMMNDSFGKVEEIESSLELPVLGIVSWLPVPFAEKNKDRFIIYMTLTVCLILVAAIIFFEIRGS